MASSKMKPSDPGSPFHLAGSDNPGILLTTVMLRGEANYENWAKLMKNALRAKNKLGFVTGTVKKPEEDDGEEWRAWEMCNSMINGWIHNTIDAKLQPFIKCFDEVKDLWDDLKERYAVENSPRQYQLKTSLANIKQLGNSVGEYYTKLRAVWDELEGSKTRKTCDCGDKCAYAKEIEEEKEHDRVYQFLMGLDEAVFGNLSSQILNTSPLPNVNKVYAIVTQEETHRNIARHQEERENVVGYVAQVGLKDKMESHDQHTISGKQAERVSCPHCGKTNHDPSRCWNVIGFPANRFGGRGRGRGRSGGRHQQAHAMQTWESSQPAVASYQGDALQQAAAAASYQNNVPLQVTANSMLTPEIMNKLIALVEQPSNDKLSGKITHFQWLIDSGASRHMTGSLNLLTKIRKINHLSVTLPNGSVTLAEKEGTMMFNAQFKLSNVLYVPQLRCNLISVSQLLRNNSRMVTFTDKNCLLQDQILKREIGLGELKEGVYVFQPKHASASAVRAEELWSCGIVD
ncbi:uncharacterized protein LOC133298774 [Gastrolobium bilobum]|uniref:uncharacterized protein LOC133298774 n=1 Tax=Gastrolobium bilobum TaxID=150636 RepID=UPI002AB04F89|nr:uncharacterized protein LOC133298774 [Gastrolobium bilobum]